MAKSLILSIALTSLIIGSFADPIFLLSTKKIDDASNKVFLDTDSFTNLLNQKFLQSDSVPNNIYLFNVKLHDRKYIQDPSLILKEIRDYPSLKNSFGASPNTFSSMYVKDALTKDFKDQVINTVQKGGFETLHTDLPNFNFEAIKNLKKTSGKNVFGVVDVKANELNSLNALFHHLYSNFGQASRQNHLIILKFTDETANAFSTLETARVLQDEGAEAANPEQVTDETDKDTPAPTTPATPTTTGAKDNVPIIGISAPGFTGYIFSIFAFIALVVGFQIMSDIKSPARFYKDQLQIGKEH